MANIADGIYNAKITAGAVYEKNGLKLELHLALCDEGGNNYTQIGSDGNEYPIEKRAYYTLISNDGAVNTKIIEMIKAWAKGWDGIDPFWFAEAVNTDAIGMVEVTVKTEPSFSDPSKSYQNIKFINELGHNANHGGVKIVQSGDKAAIMAKYGAKLKAAFGSTPKAVSAASLARPNGTPAVASAPRVAPAAPARKITSVAPSAPAPASKYEAGLKGQGQVWDEFCNEHQGDSQDVLSTAWFAALDKIAPGKDQSDLTAEEWGMVAAQLDLMPF